MVADSAATDIMNSSRDQVNFDWFYQQYMPGDSGSVVFAREQQLENTNTFLGGLDQLKNLDPVDSISSDSVMRVFQREDSLLVADPVSITEDSVQIVYNKLLSDSLMLLYGIYKEVPAMFGITPDQRDFRILWEIELPSAPTTIKNVNDSSFLISGMDDKIWVSHIYASGREKLSFKLSEKAILKLDYFELKGNYVSVAEDAASDTSVVYTTYDFNGKKSEQQSLGLGGTYVNLILNDQKLWFFSLSESINGSILTTSIYDQELKLLNKFRYQFDVDFLNPQVIKNDNETITVLSEAYGENDTLIYSLLDYEGNIKAISVF
jgi:hypothetical protein